MLRVISRYRLIVENWRTGVFSVISVSSAFSREKPLEFVCFFMFPEHGKSVSRIRVLSKWSLHSLFRDALE